MRGFIYKLTFPNGKVYVGQTTNLKERRAGISRYKSCTLVQKAMNKYGWCNVKHEIVEEVEFDDISVLNKSEEDYIIKFNTLSPNGYNLRSIGENKLVSNETRKKLRNSQLKYLMENEHPFTGRKHSKETCEKISRLNTGKPSPTKGKQLSEEHKTILREANAKWVAETGGFWTGKKMSEKAVQNMKNSWFTKRDRYAVRKAGVRKNNKTGYQGVSFEKTTNKYFVEITVERKTIYLGRFKTLEEAIESRKQGELKYWNQLQ